MKKLLFTAIFGIIFFSCSSNKTTYLDELKQYQYELNVHFSTEDESPLSSNDLKTFKSLDFFEIDEIYKVEAKLELTPKSPIFEMPTTTERLPLYKKYGIATFNLNGKEFKLNLYKSQKEIISIEYSNLLFLPFTDLTNGDTSYGGGRFIDIETPQKDAKTIIIDFNKAYNPYCAYNSKYSCPIPPRENNLNIEIFAGVKKYNKQY